METWGCGYTKGDVSMQSTGSSFSEPISTLFKTIIPSKYTKNFTKELFPRKNWTLKFEMNDWILNNIYIPTVKFIDKTLSLFRWIQCGRVGIYVLYIVLTLLSLIIWGILWK